MNTTQAVTTVSPLQIEIIGDVGKVYEPKLICNKENRIFISWKESEYFLNYDLAVYDHNDTIYIQEIFSNGSLKGSQVIIFNNTDIPFDVYDTADVNIVLDTDDNFNIFWYVLETTGENVSSSNQFGHLFYKKLDSDLSVVEDVKIVFSYDYQGISSNVFTDYCIEGLMVDNYDRFHLLLYKEFYLYVDNNGLLLDFFNMTSLELGDDYRGNTYSLANDKLNNTFVVSNVYYDYLYFTRFQISGNDIVNITTQELIFDDVTTLSNIEVLFSDGKIYVSWLLSMYPLVTAIKEVDYNGIIMQDVDLAIRKGFFSRNQTIVYSFSYMGVDYLLEDLELHYSVFSFTNEELLTQREILRVVPNYSYQYSPSIHGLQCIEDLDLNLWLAWYINDGANNYQVLYWKISVVGNYLIPVTEISPEYYEYPIFLIFEFLPLSFTFLLLISVSIISIRYFRGNKKKNY